MNKRQFDHFAKHKTNRKEIKYGLGLGFALSILFFSTLYFSQSGIVSYLLNTKTTSQTAAVSGAGSGLIAHYTFDEGSGTTAGDSVGSSDGTVNGATWTSGKVGNGALSFDGVDDKVSWSNKLLVTSYPASVCAWAKPQLVRDANSASIFSQSQFQFKFFEQYGKLKLSFYDGYVSLTPSTTVLPDQWIHACVVVSSDMNVKMYMNGAELPESVTLTNTYFNGSMSIGGNFKGEIDEVRVYNKALSLADIQTLHQGSYVDEPVSETEPETDPEPETPTEEEPVDEPEEPVEEVPEPEAPVVPGEDPFVRIPINDEGSLIPSSRLTNWTVGVTVGVPGGIPTNRTNIIDVTQAPYNADKTGASDATSAINSALNAAPANSVVYLPAGTYRISGNGIYMTGKSDITLRGEGPDKTFIDCRANRCITFGGIKTNTPATVKVVGGVSKGSSNLTLADASKFAVGSMITIATKNDESLPVISVSGYRYLQKQYAIVKSKSGNTITISPPLIAQFDPSDTLASAVTQKMSSSLGIESLTVDGINAKPMFGINLNFTYGSWIKDVNVLKMFNYSVNISDSLFCEFRGNYLDELNRAQGSNGAGLLMSVSTGCLVEDNIVYKSFPTFEINASVMGSVFGYNFTTWGNTNINHNPHNSFNLYEGNVVDNIMSDGYFGGSSHETFFRNWFRATAPDANGNLRGTYSIALKRFSRNFSIVGNQVGTSGRGDGGYSLGQPNIGNSSWTGTAQPSVGDYWDDWSAVTGLSIRGVLTERTSDSSGVFTVTAGHDKLLKYCKWHDSNGYCLALGVDWGSGVRYMGQKGRSGNQITLSGNAGDPLPPQGTEVGFWPRSEGFQELDHDVEATTLKKANWLAKGSGGSIPSDEKLPSGQSIPNSLYLSGKPSWFGSLAWPPFDSFNPRQDPTAIPAGYRYYNGEPPSGVTNEPPVEDSVAPTITAFTIPSTSSSLIVPISSFVATDNVSVSRYLINEVATKPSASDQGWQVSAPVSYTFTSGGNKTLYAWVKDGAGNISESKSATTIIVVQPIADTTSPSILSITASKIKPTSVLISWSTNEHTKGEVQYGVNTSYGSAKQSSTLALTHSVTLENLNPNTLYNYKIVATDSSSNVSNSENGTFLTPPTTIPQENIDDENLPEEIDDFNVPPRDFVQLKKNENNPNIIPRQNIIPSSETPNFITRTFNNLTNPFLPRSTTNTQNLPPDLVPTGEDVVIPDIETISWLEYLVQTIQEVIGRVLRGINKILSIFS